MGFFKRLFSEKEIVVDPADLTLPDVIPTDHPGVILKKAAGEQRVDINVVGESFRPRNLAAVAAAAQGNRFDIYLLADPNNEHDPKAVAVYAANIHLGYIAKPGNREWFKWVGEAFARGELLWGTAKIVSKPGTANSGVFGSINMPQVAKEADEIIAQQLTDAALQKAIEKVITLSNASSDPETVAQAKSLSKKAVGVAAPFVAHAKWVADNPEGQTTEQWDDIMAVCDSIYTNAADVTYITDESEVNVIGPIEELAELVAQLRTAT